jgi:hypothetical protein
MKVHVLHEEQPGTELPAAVGSPRMNADAYNYEQFDTYVEHGGEQREFAAFPGLLHAGDPAPEIAGTLLAEGEAVALSSIWQRWGPCCRPTSMESSTTTGAPHSSPDTFEPASAAGWQPTGSPRSRTTSRSGVRSLHRSRSAGSSR